MRGGIKNVKNPMPFFTQAALLNFNIVMDEWLRLKTPG